MVDGALVGTAEARASTMAAPAAGPLINVQNLSASMAVADIDATANWYHEHLGFEIVKRHDFPEYGTRIVFLEVNGFRMELIQDSEMVAFQRPDPPKHTHFQGVSQLYFLVDDIAAVIEEVKKRPITVAWDLIVVDDLRMKEFFIRDNEGNIVQFVELF